MMSIVYGPKWPFYSRCNHIGLLGIGFMQVMYLGRAPRTKETLPDFREKCRVTRHSRVFRGLAGSQRTPRVWGVTSGVSNTCGGSEIYLRSMEMWKTLWTRESSSGKSNL